MSYLTIFYGFLCDCIVFRLSFSWTQVFAIAMILAATIVTSVLKMRLTTLQENNRKQVDEFISSEKERDLEIAELCLTSPDYSKSK